METQQQFRSLNKSHWSQCSIQRDVYGCHQVIQLDDGRAHAKSNCEVANSQLRGWARESCSFLPCVQLASTAHSLLWAEVLNTVQRLLFWGHRLRWVRHRGSNRCHYPLNWLGHASTFPSCLTSPYYNSLSSHYCHVVHVLCTYIIARHKNIECIECAQSQVVETNADLFRRNQLCLHRRFGRLALIAFLCVYSLSWRKWTLCSTSDGRISFVTSLLTVDWRGHHSLTGGRKSWRCEIGGNMLDDGEEKHSEEKYSANTLQCRRQNFWWPLHLYQHQLVQQATPHRTLCLMLSSPYFT